MRSIMETHLTSSIAVGVLFLGIMCSSAIALAMPQSPMPHDRGYTSKNSYCPCPYTLKKGEDCKKKVTEMEAEFRSPSWQGPTVYMSGILFGENNLVDGKELCETAKEGDEICYEREKIPKDGKKEMFCKEDWKGGPNQ
ncbi:hypothetical protein BJ508DRAFT_328700 [Ascobolus immersus RN42]|uniref:Uncharacterized protein n=1 Tax=Ascobolus immersus RN42 TaxID=1160509 RepID=A0A3N4I4G4_ASCIM|nr:hypothetical protein BJ508DRAFT_328700 [Ascobolus immersus RN42]